MGVLEVDRAFGNMIDRSGELIRLGTPSTTFEMLKPKPPVEPPKPRIDIDFELVRNIDANTLKSYDKEYSPLLAELIRFEPKCLTISSTEPGQGVSFTAQNLATLWAKNGNKRILLLEFYNGVTGSVFDNPVDMDAEVFKNSQHLEDYLVYSPSNGIYLYSVSASQVETTGFEDFWQRIQSSFDLIIVDAAPLGFNIMTDHVIPKSTGVIMISSQNPDPVRVKYFEDSVREYQGRFLGVVLNATN